PPDPPRRVRGADRRLRGRRPRRGLRHLRRPAVVLPVRRRRRRPPVPRRVPQLRPEGGRAARRRARRRAAADQHPAGRPGGRGERPRLPPRQGPRPVRVHAGAGRDGPVPRPAGPAHGPRPVRGEPGGGLVRHRPAAAADAGPPQRRLRRGDGGHLPAAAAPDRRRPRRRAGDAHVPAGLGEGRGVRAGDGGDRPMSAGDAGAHVAVVGGGLAGVTAALALQETGVRTTVYEARPRLGGATHSFERDGLTVDNGQHIFLKCCTAYRGLLERLGALDRVHVQDRFDVRVLTPGGRSGRLRRAKAPGPLHFLPALARYAALPPADRLRAVRAALALQRLDPADPSLDGIAMDRWLARHGQRPEARRALWELFVTAALNIRLEEAALGPAAMVCQTALLGRSDAADIGVASVPLGDLHGAVPAARIERDGGRVHLGAKVTAIEAGPKLVVNGSPVAADAVVLAVPHRQAAGLVPAEACPDRDRWAGLGSSPIVNVHVVYDRPVMDEPFAAAVGSPVQWVFDRTAVGGLTGGQYLAV